MELESKKEELSLTYKSTTAKKAQLQSKLYALLNDPILSDVPKQPSLSDVDTLISLELGSAMKITVVRMDNASFDVAVLNTATVKDLKVAIKRKTDAIEQGQLGHRHISCVVVRSKVLEKSCHDSCIIMKGFCWKHFIIVGCRMSCPPTMPKRHVWANFCLAHGNDKLINEDAPISDHGVRNNSQVHFIPYAMSRAVRKHSRRKKHRFFHGLSRRS